MTGVRWVAACAAVLALTSAGLLLVDDEPQSDAGLATTLAGFTAHGDRATSATSRASVSKTGAPTPAPPPTPPEQQPQPTPAPTPEPSSAPPPAPPSWDERMSNRVLELVNNARANAGCRPVTMNANLTNAAIGHSTDMAEQDYFDHTSRDGRTPWDRARAAGYSAASGENIAKGQRDADEVMRAWLDSPGHRANILNCDAVAMGLGVVTASNGVPFWTQMFGSE